MTKGYVSLGVGYIAGIGGSSGSGGEEEHDPITEKPEFTLKLPPKVEVVAGESVTFDVMANNHPSYRWVPFNTSQGFEAIYKFDEVGAVIINCYARNGIGQTRTLCNVTVTAPPPVITTQPEDVTASETKTAVFTVVAKYAKSYQWQIKKDASWTDISGYQATVSDYFRHNLTVEESNCGFRCIVKNDKQEQTISEAAILIVIALPNIIIQPKNISVIEGEKYAITVTAENFERLQWLEKLKGTSSFSIIDGEALYALDKIAIKSDDGNEYKCRVFNEIDDYIDSNISTVTILDKPTIRIECEGGTLPVTATYNNPVMFEPFYGDAGVQDTLWYYKIDGEDAVAFGTFTELFGISAKEPHSFSVFAKVGDFKSNVINLTCLNLYLTPIHQVVRYGEKMRVNANFIEEPEGEVSYNWFLSINGEPVQDMNKHESFIEEVAPDAEMLYIPFCEVIYKDKSTENTSALILIKEK